MADLIGRYDRRLVEKSLLVFAQGARLTGNSCEYIVAGDALLPKSTIEKTPGFAERIRAFHGRLTTIRLPFAADVILLKTNMRVMGLTLDGIRWSAKIMLNASEAEASLVREIRARRVAREILRDTPLLGVPDVHSWDRASRQWMIEQQIDGQQAALPMLQSFLAEHLSAFYGASVRSRPLGQGVKRRRLAAAISEIQNLGLPLFVDGDSRLAVAFVHGDLIPSNVVSSADKLWLVDWEYGGRGAVCFDLGGMCAMEPALVPAALQLMRGLTSAGELTAEVQLAIGLAEHLAERRAGMRSEVAAEMRIRKQPQTEAARAVGLRIKRMEITVRQLLSHAGPSALL